MTAADTLKQWIKDRYPGFKVQFGRFTDGATSDRFIVIRPIGGINDQYIRQSLFSVLMIGATNDATTNMLVYADDFVQQMRDNYRADCQFLMQSSEPTFTQTAEGRPVFELSIDMQGI